jgi:hypothetical protein
MTSRIETSRRNFEQFQKIGRDLGNGLECMILAVREQHDFLKALPKNSPVDPVDHLGALTTREDRFRHVNDFAKRWEFEL